MTTIPSAENLVDLRRRLLGRVGQRILALIVDLALTMAAVFVISKMLGTTSTETSYRLLSFCFTVYLGLSQSYLGNGQSLGYKLTKIRVSDMQGHSLSLKNSLIRTAVFTLPYIISPDLLPHSLIGTTSGYLMGSIISAATIAIGIGIDVLILLHPLRRGLHDLIAGAIVAQAAAPDIHKVETLNNPKRRKIAYGLAILLAVLLIGGREKFQNRLPPLILQLLATGKYQKAETGMTYEQNKKILSAEVYAYPDTKEEDIESLFETAFPIIRKNIASSEKYDLIRVTAYLEQPDSIFLKQWSGWRREEPAEVETETKPVRLNTITDRLRSTGQFQSVEVKSAVIKNEQKIEVNYLIIDARVLGERDTTIEAMMPFFNNTFAVLHDEVKANSGIQILRVNITVIPMDNPFTTNALFWTRDEPVGRH